MVSSIYEATRNPMSTGKHYIIEQRPNGQYAAGPKMSRARRWTFDTRREAIDQVKQWNPDDRPDAERVRDTKAGGPNSVPANRSSSRI